MANTPNGLRSCPTRIDGAAVLFAHKLTPLQCQDRQRGRYHKCFTCVFNNAYVASNGLPVETSEVLAPAKDAQEQEQRRSVAVG